MIVAHLTGSRSYTEKNRQEPIERIRANEGVWDFTLVLLWKTWLDSAQRMRNFI